jgi:hypothetical protein
MARVPSLRASDSEREDVAERLRDATAEGRLTADELEERLEALYRSRTYGELDALVADLPVDRAPDRVRVRFPKWAGAVAAITLLVAILETLVGRPGNPPRRLITAGLESPGRSSGPGTSSSTLRPRWACSWSWESAASSSGW